MLTDTYVVMLCYSFPFALFCLFIVYFIHHPHPESG